METSHPAGAKILMTALHRKKLFLLYLHYFTNLGFKSATSTNPWMTGDPMDPFQL